MSPNGHKYYCHRQLLSTVQSVYILLSSVAFTLLVLLVCKCRELLNTARHTETKCALSDSLCSDVRRKMTS